MAFSVVLGTALIVSGVLVTILASFQYMRHIHDLQQGIRIAGTPSKLALFIALGLSAAGLAMAVYIGSRKAATPLLKHGRQEDEGNGIGK
jgi:uncharacterized YccA/Bax inhibitor family protein